MICINVMSTRLRRTLIGRRWRERNLSKARASVSAWGKAHSAEIVAKRAARRRADPEKFRRLDYTRRYYNGAYEHFRTQIKIQRNVRAICGEMFKSSPHLDHNHETKQLRGALCGCCNQGIGSFKEEPARLLKAIEYLKSWRTGCG